ncbi:phosphate ABC transporter substrate-binding protein [Vibrio sp. TRT 17S01]|uniref:phosphate ABC transporter substrate-binding protein n=1 Tax=Vibrio sp. TRT 17S01 TaxID=3418505 RepID=UPI003CF367C3
MFRATLMVLFSFVLMPVTAWANEINITGSTSVARVMDVLAEQFNLSHPETYIAVQGIGSTAGIAMVKKGVAELGMSSRVLTEREQEETLKVQPLAYDGLAVVVNPLNPIQNLTREQLYDIYRGKITNWKQLGGTDQKIAVVTREASSGTRYSFESLLGLVKVVKDRQVSAISPNNLVVNSNSMMKTLINHNKQAIGFISTGSVDHSVKAIQFEGVDANAKTIANGSYQLSRPFLVFYLDGTLDKNTKMFVSFLGSEKAKALIEEYGYIAVK